MWHLEVSRKLRRMKDNPGLHQATEPVSLHDLSLVLDELRRRRNARGTVKRAPLTEWMIRSKVGDTTVIAPKTQSAITTCRRSARKAMRNEDARWHAQTLEDGRIEIMRMDDGSSHLFGLPRNPIPGKLAAMNRHGRLVIDYDGRRFPSKFKVLAREMMGDPKADWRYTMLSTGSVRVVRVR